MPFGQMGLVASQDSGGGSFFDRLLRGLPDIILGPSAGLFPAPPSLPGPGLVQPQLQVPGLGTLTGQPASNALFRPTASRIMPVTEFSLIGPDGKCHTWLHARPKGWKINRSNVSGRRRHRHHSFH